MDPELLLKNIASTVRTAKTFGLPIVHSTVNVASGQGKPTVPELAGLQEARVSAAGRSQATQAATVAALNAAAERIERVTRSLNQSLVEPVAIG